MGYSTVIKTIDRLSVTSIMRGSTSSLCGILGTITLLILCLVIYTPAIVKYLDGDYYES